MGQVRASEMPRELMSNRADDHTHRLRGSEPKTARGREPKMMNVVWRVSPYASVLRYLPLQVCLASSAAASTSSFARDSTTLAV